MLKNLKQRTEDDGIQKIHHETAFEAGIQIEKYAERHKTAEDSCLDPVSEKCPS